MWYNNRLTGQLFPRIFNTLPPQRKVSPKQILRILRLLPIFPKLAFQLVLLRHRPIKNIPLTQRNHLVGHCVHDLYGGGTY